MPCPLFLPSHPLGEINPGASPLGDLFTGVCQGDPAYAIPREMLRKGCNYGYAREHCALAKQAEADSFCFVIARGGAASVTVRWSQERDHHPVAVGEIEVARDAGNARDAIEAQAQAYASVYWRRLS